MNEEVIAATIAATSVVVGMIATKVVDGLVPFWQSGRIQRSAKRWFGRLKCQMHQRIGFKNGWGVQGDIRYSVDCRAIGGVELLQSATLTIPGESSDPINELVIRFGPDETVATFSCVNPDNRWGVAQHHMASREYRGSWAYGNHNGPFTMYCVEPQLEGRARSFCLPLSDFDSRNLASGLMRAEHGTKLLVGVVDHSGDPDAKERRKIPYKAPLAHLLPIGAMETPAQPHIEKLWRWSSEARAKRDAEARALRDHAAGEGAIAEPGDS